MRERVATTTRTYLACLRIPRATLPAGREVGWAERLTATHIRRITPNVIPQIYGSPPGSITVSGKIWGRSVTTNAVTPRSQRCDHRERKQYIPRVRGLQLQPYHIM